MTRSGNTMTLVLAAALLSGCPTPAPTDARSAPAIEEELLAAAPDDRWADVPPQYREWAEDRLRERLELGAENLVAQESVDRELAIERVPELTSTIARLAREDCTVIECVGRQLGATEIAERLRELMCPGFFPFC